MMKTSTNSGLPMLNDALILEIFSRLPAKSIARFRCVSKQWAYDLRLPFFTDLFFTRSCARPQLLFACQRHGHVFFFTSPQPQNIDEKRSYLLAATHQMKVTYAFSPRLFSLTKGLVFLGDYRIPKHSRQRREVPVICNPSTGQSMLLPNVKSWRNSIERWSFLGYDPVEKQYKVLSMTDQSQDHQVLTFGNGGPSWRKIECCTSYYPHPGYNQICIDGVLYYGAVDSSSKVSIIVCFDVRSEKFRFVKDTKSQCALLINYNGKVASIGSQCSRGISNRCTSIKLRVLQDAEKHEWSEHIYALPALWKNVVGASGTVMLHFVGVTRTNEIVMSSSSLQAAPFYVFYYNTERNTVTRVEIQGLEFFMSENISIYLDLSRM